MKKPKCSPSRKLTSAPSEAPLEYIDTDFVCRFIIWSRLYKTAQREKFRSDQHKLHFLNVNANVYVFQL